MRKKGLYLLAVSALTLSLVACGGNKGMTEEEMQKMIDEKVAAGKEAVAKEADEACKAKMDGLVQVATDSIVAAAAAVPAAPGK